MDDIELWLFGHDHSLAIYEPYRYEDVTSKAGRLIGNGACQYREDSISNYLTTTHGTFEASEDEVPRPVIKNIFLGYFVLMNIGLDSILVNYSRHHKYRR